MFGVYVQPITNDTGAENVEKYGEILDFDAVDSDGQSRDFCDGATSMLPPRNADDQMGMIYTYDRATAETFSGVVRRDLAARIASGQVAQSPSWLAAAAVSAQTAALAESIIAAETLPSTILQVREALRLSSAITDGQIATQLQNLVIATGNATPSLSQIVEWIQLHAPWT